MDSNLSPQQIPFNWPLCYLDACPQKDECLRYLAYQHTATGRVKGSSVFPSVLKQPLCPMFHPIRKVRIAVGFQNLFNEVKKCHYASMTSELRNYLGSRATFYRYRSGENTLSPEQQAWIAALFRRYGYTEEPSYDAYKEVYLIT